MSAIKVYFEMGHEAVLKPKKTPEGFTHDWKVFVRGQEGADISHIVDYVVFHLHETFPDPKRTVKDPPFSIEESGWAGFYIPIELYLKNKGEPKKIRFIYNLSLDEGGYLRDRYIFRNPNEQFKKKLIAYGGIPVDDMFYANPGQEYGSRDSFTEDKQQLLKKSKLCSERVTKHKNKDYKDELSHISNTCKNVFGAPLQKPTKTSPETKKSDENTNITKSNKKDKNKSNFQKKSKLEHKKSKLDEENIKVKEEKEKNQPSKKNKQSRDRPQSPTENVANKHYISPSSKMSPLHSNSISNMFDSNRKIMMSAIKVHFEIGHVASTRMRCKRSPEGFTHDWKVFVRGKEGADISNFVDKVVFHLHETYHKPRREVEEPPFFIKESGYAGFNIPIEIYLKNKEEPKKIKLTYDLSLQISGSSKHEYIFQNLNEEFRKKLLKGGGIPTNSDQENKSRDSFTEEKQQVVNEPKLSSEGIKTHKRKNNDYKDELPDKSKIFEHLFGVPLKKPSKISPESKKNDKHGITTKPDKKDTTNSEKKSKHDHNKPKLDKENIKEKEGKEKNLLEKIKVHQETGKENFINKCSRDWLQSQTNNVANKRCISPSRKMSPPSSSSISSLKDKYKPQEPREPKKLKIDDRQLDIKVEEKKKDKKHHEKDKERKDKKEHKKEVYKPKKSSKESKDICNELMKSKETIRGKETSSITIEVKEKSIQTEKLNKFSIANLPKTPSPENEEHFDNHKIKDKSDSDRKHKHKKKDKKCYESKEKYKESSEDKKNKHEKIKDTPTVVPDTDLKIDQSPESKRDLSSELEIEMDPETEMIPKPNPQLRTQLVLEIPPTQTKEKLEKHKNKSPRRKEKRRIRKSVATEHDATEHDATEHDATETKRMKTNDTFNNNETKREDSSFKIAETNAQNNGVASNLEEDAEPDDSDVRLILRQRILAIAEEQGDDINRVMKFIAETVPYVIEEENTIVDLDLLDRSTIQQLIQLVGC